MEQGRGAGCLGVPESRAGHGLPTGAAPWGQQGARGERAQVLPPLQSVSCRLTTTRPQGAGSPGEVVLGGQDPGKAVEAGKMQTNWLIEPVAPPAASAPTCSQECRQLHPFQALPRALGPTWERALPGPMEAGFGEPGKAGGALRGRFPVVWRFVNREVGRSGQ